MKFFFKMNIHPEGPNFGYFLFQQWYPRPKKLSGTNFHAFSCPSIHVVTNFLKVGKNLPLVAKFHIAINREALKQFQKFFFIDHFLYS